MQLHHPLAAGIGLLALAAWTVREAFATPHWRKFQLYAAGAVTLLGLTFIIVSFT